MGAVDPTYPLYPVAELLSSVMLFLVLTTNLARQKWNLGVTSLCFWLFLESLAEAISAIVWSDDADVKLYVYCDIVTHVNVIAYVVKPMATLMITRRLYLIASLRSVEPPTQAEKLWDLALEWTLGLVIPLLVAGPIYFVNQYARFLVIAGFGCTTATGLSVVELLVMDTWPIIPPLVSVVFYYPKVVRIFYRQGRDVNSFLRTNSSVSRTNYFRILALASIDVLLTLPIGIVNVSLSIVGEQTGGYPFVYPGWTFIHTDWEPESITYDEFRVSKGFGTLVQTYFSQWSSPVLAFTIFGLFGLTSEARTLYWRITCNIGGWFGWSPSPRAGKGQASLGEIEFGARPQNTSASDPEMGARSLSIPGTNARTRSHGTGQLSGGCAMSEGQVDQQSVEETHHKDFTEDVNPRHVDVARPAPTAGHAAEECDSGTVISGSKYVGTGASEVTLDTVEDVGGSANMRT